MGLFIGLAGSLGFTGRAAKLAAVIMAVVAAIALCASLAGAWQLFDWLNDRQAVQRDVAKTNAEISRRQVGAERAAGAELGNAVAAARTTQQQQEEQAHAARRDRHSALDALANGM